MPRKFEYAINRVELAGPTEDNHWGDVEMLSVLNALGADGWEVVQIIATGDATIGCWILLKRERESEFISEPPVG